MKKIIRMICFALLALAFCMSAALASQPDQSYTYDGNDQVVPSTNVYQVAQIVSGETMGIGNLKGAQDIFVDNQDHVYILDSGNQRVVVLDEDFHCIRELKEFTYQDQVITLANNAQGIFYHDAMDKLYIADTENNRIIVTDLNGQVFKVYEKPVSELLEAELSYAPKKIIVDNMGLMYVISTHINTGALLIDGDNNFLGFYGINPIKETLQIKIEYLWRSIMTDEQNAQSSASFQPTEFNNLFWSNDRFVYAVSPERDSLESSVVKLNAIGNNVLSVEGFYGDVNKDGAAEPSRFVDITVDNEKVFTLLNSKNNRLYQYDDNSNLLTVFGGTGSQKGLFQGPTSIESDSKNRLLVLDGVKNTVTVLEQTYYGRKIREATKLHNDGRYKEALELWSEVIKLNANFNLAYVGLGKAHMELGEYDLAKKYFRMADDQENYASAKEALREQWLRDHFAFVSLMVGLLIVVTLLSDVIKKLLVSLCRKLFPRKEEIRA